MLRTTLQLAVLVLALPAHAAEWTRRGDVTAVDVGSGTGLLAVFCARAGARRVLAVEASRLAHFTRQVLEANVPIGAELEMRPTMYSVSLIGTTGR